MDNIDLKMQTILNSYNLKLPEKYIYTIDSTLKKLPNRKRNISLNLKLSFATICCSIILITGIVFANEIEDFILVILNNFGLGKGVSTAVDNGYIGTSDEDVLEKEMQIIENDIVKTDINVKTNINEFIITDNILSVNMNFEFKNKINDYVEVVKTENGDIDYEKSYSIKLEDLLIVDEENRVLYCNIKNENYFKNICKTYDLDCKYPTDNVFSDNYIINEYIHTKENSTVNTICSLTSSNGFGTPKKIKMYFSEVTLSNYRLENGHKITLLGNWEFNLDVPANMYNRTVGEYTVVNCENEYFKVYETKLTDTEFEIGIEISNVKKPVYPNELLEKEKIISNANKDANGNEGYSLSFGKKEDIVKFYESEELANLWEGYYKNYYIVGDAINLFMPWLKEDRTCYVENSVGEKFRLKPISLDAFIENDKYDYKAKCEMNKYTATDNISIVIIFDGKPIRIELSK